jgi:hypothetical protein
MNGRRSKAARRAKSAQDQLRDTATLLTATGELIGDPAMFGFGQTAQLLAGSVDSDPSATLHQDEWEPSAWFREQLDQTVIYAEAEARKRGFVVGQDSAAVMVNPDKFVGATYTTCDRCGAETEALRHASCAINVPASGLSYILLTQLCPSCAQREGVAA